MDRSRAAAFVCAMSLLTVVTVGTAAAQGEGKKYGPGVTDSEILMGQTVPYSGPVSFAGANGVGDLAFMKMLNEQGGINGRQLKLLSQDDGYLPPKTLEITRKLVEQDNIAFLYSSLGTGPNSAIGKYITDRHLPHLLFNTGTDKFYSGEYPTMVPYFPRYGYQAEVLTKWIKAHKPDAKIAFLYQNDDFGTNFLEGTKKILGDKASNVVKAVSFEVRDPTVDFAGDCARRNEGRHFVHCFRARATGRTGDQEGRGPWVAANLHVAEHNKWN